MIAQTPFETQPSPSLALSLQLQKQTTSLAFLSPDQERNQPFFLLKSRQPKKKTKNRGFPYSFFLKKVAHLSYSLLSLAFSLNKQPTPTTSSLGLFIAEQGTLGRALQGWRTWRERPLGRPFLK